MLAWLDSSFIELRQSTGPGELSLSAISAEHGFLLGPWSFIMWHDHARFTGGVIP